MKYKPIKLNCDYIGDKRLFAAVCFSIRMIRDGVSPGLAHHKAAKYWNVQRKDVAKYVGQHAVRAKEDKQALREADE